MKIIYKVFCTEPSCSQHKKVVEVDSYIISRELLAGCRSCHGNLRIHGEPELIETPDRKNNK